MERICPVPTECFFYTVKQFSKWPFLVSFDKVIKKSTPKVICRNLVLSNKELWTESEEKNTAKKSQRSFCKRHFEDITSNIKVPALTLKLDRSASKVIALNPTRFPYFLNHYPPPPLHNRTSVKVSFSLTSFINK